MPSSISKLKKKSEQKMFVLLSLITLTEVNHVVLVFSQFNSDHDERLLHYAFDLIGSVPLSDN